MIKQTKKNLEELKSIRKTIDGFHQHVSILKDISDSLDQEKIVYVEIGCFAGATAALMLADNRTEVISVDLGLPITPEVVKGNIKDVRESLDRFEYIEGDSRSEETVQKLQESLGEQQIDILFIDGDHSEQGVKDDFYNYSPFVKKGGFVVFDDYLDAEHSPQVFPAVNSILLDLSGYEKIGTPENTYGALPSQEKIKRFSKLNDFIIRKHV